VPYGPEQFDLVADDLARQSFAVWSIGYRRVGETGGGWPGTADDVEAALDLLPQVTASLGVDLGRVFVIGHSAGGQLALSVVPALVTLFAVIGLAPISDLALAFRLGLGRNAVGEFIGGSPDEFPDRYSAASPFARPRQAVSRMIVHGRMDEAVPLDMSRTYVQSRKRLGEDISYHEVEDAGHLDFLNPRSSVHTLMVSWISSRLSGYQ